MPKLKTHRGAKKRFSRTASGRFTHRRGYRNHILTKKSAKRLRHLRHNGLVDRSDTAAIARLLPYD
jgi:large subunit ribosomal protein L35